MAKIKKLTNGLGAHSVIEAVGTQELMQAIRSTRPGGHVGYVGVSHDVALSGEELFFSGVHLHGGPAPVRRFLPQLIQLIWERRIDPARCSTSPSRSSGPRTAMKRWTNAAPPKCSSPSEPRALATSTPSDQQPIHGSSVARISATDRSGAARATLH